MDKNQARAYFESVAAYAKANRYHPINVQHLMDWYEVMDERGTRIKSVSYHPYRGLKIDIDVQADNTASPQSKEIAHG